MKNLFKEKPLFVFLVLTLVFSLFSVNPYQTDKVYGDTTSSNSGVHIVYQAHSQTVGWQDSVSDGTLAGTTGRNLRLEALDISIQGISGDIQYRSYVEGSGWQSYVSNGATTGTIGKRKSIMAIQISLKGEVNEKYDLYYQIHKSNVGWMGWVPAGKEAGTSCINNKIEAIQIMLVPKGSAAPSNLSSIVSQAPSVYYSAHVSDIGWQDYAYNSGVAGTTTKNLKLEAAKMKLSTKSFGIQYSFYVEKDGWQDYVSDDAIAGTTGRALKTFGLKIRLTGYQAANYSVYYRTYNPSGGWGQWVCDGAVSGSDKEFYMLEAFQVIVIKKGDAAPTASTPVPSLDPITLKYSTHVQTYGWQNITYNNGIAGTTGQAKRVEAIQMSISGVPASKLGIKYSTHVQTIGWQDWKSNGQIAGTTGQAKRVEAIKIELTGTDASKYDIYYRVHAQKLGWLGWTSNGDIAGTTGLKYRVEAIQVIIVAKGDPAPGSTRKPYVSTTYKGIDVSFWQQEIDWNKVADANYDFAMIRIQYGKAADKYYKQNITGANNVGLKVGGYCYSIATNVKEAEDEAHNIVSLLKGYKITYPIAYDIEDNYYQGNLTTEERTNMVLAFKKIIEANGYDFILYANKNWLENYLDYNKLSKAGVDVWLARYRDEDLGFDNPNDIGNDKIKFPASMIKIWQYSSQGKVPGITGSVDMNIAYKAY